MCKQDRKNRSADENRLIGMLIDGFGTKALVIAFAVWVAYEAAMFVSSSLAPIVSALGGQ